jgi:hypothetical protein
MLGHSKYVVFCLLERQPILSWSSQGVQWRTRLPMQEQRHRQIDSIQAKADVLFQLLHFGA